ncbi:MAG: toll/interleukin-1 receptor domain-containing protein [Ignavibacteriae bacterium]|nr:toll/interleukin-1 receptor domain-containing protein [Ignavibacteriota bacterium]
MSTEPYAFVSYQTDDKHVAGTIKKILESVGIKSFLAHEDIEVSEEWRVKILKEIGKADIFVCILSNSYLKSHWCIQESGIAAFRKDITVIPLSIDGTVPQAFLGNIQSAKINPDTLGIKDLIPGFLRRDITKGLSILVKVIGSSGNYRGAEENFALIIPYLDKLTQSQGKSLLEASIKNSQVHDAGRCANEYIPQVLKLFGHTLDPQDRQFLEKTCRRYGADI